MKEKKRRISTEMKLIFGIVIAILVCLVSVYIYNNYLVGRSFKDNIPLFTVGLLVIIISLLSFFAIWCLIGLLIVVLLDLYNSKRSKEQIKTMPNHFVNIYFKDFDNFRLASFVDSEDITCFAKIDENGNIVYALQLNVEYETDDYETFLKHFDI
jgi:ABC-type uncharacterized transport system fused permease/ATPase subunit